MSHHFSLVRLHAGLHQTDWLRDLARQGEAYRDHALIWRLFPGQGAERDFVFRRLDEPPNSYYVVSARPPAISHEDSGLFHVRSKPYRPAVQMGELLRFELRANPVISRRSARGRSQRHDVLMQAKRSAPPGADLAEALEAAGRVWFMERAAHWGLAVHEASLLQSGYTQHRLRRKGQDIHFSSLDYQGVAQVTDAAKLAQALLQGVGHAKGFGCGLLLVKRLRATE